MGEQNYSFIVELEHDLREGGHYVITSSNLPGLVLAGKDLSALRDDVPAAIKMLFKLNYEIDVDVRWVTDPDGPKSTRRKVSEPSHYPTRWIASPIAA